MNVSPASQNRQRNVWARIAAFFVKRRLKSVPDCPLDFFRLLNEPKEWLLVMPAEANVFDLVLPLCLDLLGRLNNVRLHLLVPYDFLHWVTVSSPNLKVHPFHKQDLFLGRFPRRPLLDRLTNLIKPDVAVDLSPQPTPLSLTVCGLSGAKIRGSIARAQGNDVFNLLVESGAANLEDRYRALFACL
jgi:hypothetical protein